MEIGANTRLLVILGDPVGHSLSPSMHNAAIRALGLDAAYLAMRTTADTLPVVLQALAAVGAAGNVTVPHKQATERYVTRKTELCARVGACNTFWTEHGAMVGDNTDVSGVRAAVHALGADGAGRWLVLGTGGSARAVAIAAGGAQARLLVRSRDPGRARAFVDWASAHDIAARVAAATEPCDLVINTTPLGLKEGDPLPISPTQLNGARAALDLTYAAGETPWVRTLRAAGIAACDGREVLLHQGAAAFTRFFPGEEPPLDVMRAAVARALRV
ncbi:MAG TPA: shikimate dehydrogenase [Gemmatimonadales bacterium]|nr:shikimate dehydrogenase [Gemmatimonadales bacterium]